MGTPPACSTCRLPACRTALPSFSGRQTYPCGHCGVSALWPKSFSVSWCPSPLCRPQKSRFRLCASAARNSPAPSGLPYIHSLVPALFGTQCLCTKSARGDIPPPSRTAYTDSGIRDTSCYTAHSRTRPCSCSHGCSRASVRSPSGKPRTA